MARRRASGARPTRTGSCCSSPRLTLLSFEAADAGEAADIRAHLKRLATPIGPYDVLIAAQARRAGSTLVTTNTRAFERVPGLMVTDWAA
jgi:tRNA(fMet)-specific endonuclease VapC